MNTHNMDVSQYKISIVENVGDKMGFEVFATNKSHFSRFRWMTRYAKVYNQ